MKKLLAFFIFVLSLVFCATSVSAQYGQYGPPPSSLNIFINKLVGIPAPSNTDTNNINFVDNLSSSDPRFSAGQDVFFKLIVKNTSSATLTSVTVTDIVPSFIEPIEGPGSFDTTSRVITINAGDFGVNEEKDYILKMRVDNQNQLPTDKGLFCLINTAQASGNGVSDQDTAQLCIEKQVTSVSNVPTAGPEMGVLLLSLEGIAIGAGIILKKKAV